MFVFRATACIEAAVIKQPTNDLPWAQLIELHVAQNQHEHAWLELRKARKAAENKNSICDASASLERALEWHPNSALLVALKGELIHQRGGDATDVWKVQRARAIVVVFRADLTRCVCVCVCLITGNIEIGSVELFGGGKICETSR